MTVTKSRRLVDALFGVFFVALALLILITSNVSTQVRAIVAAVVVGGLGLDLIISAMRGKRSLLSRIGPWASAMTHPCVGANNLFKRQWTNKLC